MDNIFKETQEDRDLEVSEFTGVPLSEVMKYEIASQKSILINPSGDLDKDDYSYLYEKYDHLVVAEYLKTLCALTVSRRSKYILKLQKIMNGFDGCKILDFGSGVGSHGIACKQLGASEVVMLDVDGPLFKFAQWRVKQRSLDITFLSHTQQIPKDYFHASICLDVLEHVSNPIDELIRITESLRVGGFLALEVSTRKKTTSGHFSKSIDKWINRGPEFLNRYYDNISKNIWKKK